MVFQNPADLDFVEEDVVGKAVREFENQVLVDLEDSVSAAA